MTYYIERCTDTQYGLTWTFVQDYDDMDKAAIALDLVRARNADAQYRLIEVLDA